MRKISYILLITIAFSALSHRVIAQNNGSEEIPEENTKAFFIYSLNKSLGTKAYNFTIENMNGDSISLDDYKGKVVLLDFWALGCTPCYQATDDLIYLDSLYADKGLVVISMHNGKLRREKHIEKIQKYLLDKDLKYLNGYADTVTINKYAWLAMPSFVLVDKQGVISYNHAGNFNVEELANFEDAINQVLR